MFDNQQPAFFDAYTEHQPLRPDYELRRRYYWLHTALVHVGLFGDEFFCDFTARTAEQIVRDSTPEGRHSADVDQTRGGASG